MLIRLIYLSIVTIVVLNQSNCYAQQLYPCQSCFPNPQNKKNFEKVGHYEMVAQPDRTEIFPGDSINISVAFSGYGSIESSKIYCETAISIFDYSQSYVLHSIHPEGNEIVFGTLKNDVPITNAFTLRLMGAQAPNWKEDAFYIDESPKDSNSLSIITEKIKPYPPAYLHLQTNKHVEPGVYSFTIVYTYFNGQEWAGQQQTVSFKIKNWSERNSTLLAALGIAIAFISIIPFLFNGIKFLTTYIKIGTKWIKLKFS